ncbi:MAG TPA: DUF504 domain-containing protein [Methanosarcinales archaeon]|nr:DUF504 domain-containing protein [Methanosarcinales archaeon]
MIRMSFFRSKRPRDILNEIKWRGYPMHECTVHYLHRGAPGNTRTVRGSAIARLGHSFFEIEDGVSIPYHRIRMIEYRDEVVYRKNHGSGRSA